jgi:hypothetical protein
VRNFGAVVLVVAAGVTAHLVPSDSVDGGSAETARKNAAPKGSSTAKLPENPVNALAGYFIPNEEPELRLAGPAHVVFAKPQRFPIRFLIASVPDPQKTLLPLYFDRWVESIILAAQDCGYSYDLFWLPWRRDAEPEGQKLDDRLAFGAWREGRMNQPGLLMFRSPRPSEPALGIWLIGETPTAGLDRRQFHNAVLYSRELSAAAQERLGILAPTFSGSTRSLVAALDEDLGGWRGGQNVRIITGSASASETLKALPGLITTVHSDATLLDALVSDASDMGLDITRNFALLAEEDTTFGRGLYEGSTQQPEVASVADYLGRSNVLFYPRDISRLRNLYPEETRMQGVPGANQPPSSEPQLSMRLRDLESGRDSLPYFSPQTPLSQESELLQILSFLKTQRRKTIVVTGTNVLDILFLSRFLRQASPDSRIVLYDADLLFVHGTDTLDFQGMLAVSSYPVLPPRGWLMRKAGDIAAELTEDQPHLLASSTAQGVYEASRALVTGNPPRFRPDSSGIWLTVVGRDRYWPLKLFAPKRNGKLEESVPDISPTRVWTCLFLAMSFVCALYVFGLLYSTFKRKSVPEWCAGLRLDSGSSDLSRWKSVHSTLITAAILLAFVVVSCAAVWQAVVQSNDAWFWWAVVAGVVVVVLAAGLAVSAVRAYWLPAGAVLVATGWFCMWTSPLLLGPTLEVQFRAMRMVELFSGVAPNAPLFLLLLGVALWGWTHMRRLSYVADRRPLVSLFSVPEAEEKIGKLTSWLRQGVLHIDIFGAVLGGLTFLTILAICDYNSGSLEPQLYDRALGVIIALTGAFLAIIAYASLRLWLALRVLLESLEQKPIRFAFSSLPPAFSWSPLWQGGAGRRSYLLLGRTLDSLHALRQSDPQFYPGLAADITSLEQQAGRVLERGGAGLLIETTDFVTLQQSLAGIAGALEQQLTARNWKQGVSESLDLLPEQSRGNRFRGWLRRLAGGGTDVEVTSHPEPMSQPERAQSLAAEVVALRYLAFIRYVMLQLRNLLSFLTTGFILAAIALNSYSFTSLNLTRWSITLGFVLLTVVTTFVLLQMNRDAILSRLAEKKAGEVDGLFLFRLISVGALPLLTVVASQFPSVGRFLFAWLQPALAALH